MNRKQKIIISVTGIFLVALILVGLTYAYFLTQINGNTNSKSISVTTANLVLEYGDGNNTLEPSTKLRPNTIVGTKTFTATNKGDDTVEDYLVYFENVNNTLQRPEDLVYTVTCKSYKTVDYTASGDNATETGTCNGVQYETQLPTGNGTGTGAILTNTIQEGYIHVYALELKYLEAGVDQSDDMNKTVTAKINIVDSKGLNPYKGNINSLAYNIVNNAMNVTDEGKALKYAEFRKKPITTPLAQASLESESVLSLTPDDYGVSYYYRGNVENNYVTFNEMCWRIVRIQGDGSIKITLTKQGLCNSVTSSDTESAFLPQYFEYNSKNILDYMNGELRNGINEWIASSFTTETKEKIKTNLWCIGNLRDAFDNNGNVIGTVSELTLSGTQFNYSGYLRFINDKPSLICDTTGLEGETDNNIIGILTMDEVAFAGGGESNESFFINDNTSGNYSWTLTPYRFDAYADDAPLVVRLEEEGNRFNEFWINIGHKARPTITLKPNIEINSGGIGTISNPYVIKAS